jgi:CheY-like chemotaxis protein
MATELSEALHDASVLAQHYRVTLQPPPVVELPRSAAPPPVLRQALLTALTVAITQARGGTIQVALAQAGANVVATLQRVEAVPGERPLTDRDASSLRTVSQLLAPFGGHVATVRASPLAVEIAVPAVESVPVLVVDDNPDTRQLFQRYAANSRFRVITTADCDQAIPLVQASAARAIVLDIMMPGVDGWDLLARLRHHPATQAIPIAVCTILPQGELAHLLGVTTFLQKPVSQQAFLEALDRLTAPTRSSAGTTPG